MLFECEGAGGGILQLDVFVLELFLCDFYLHFGDLFDFFEMFLLGCCELLGLMADLRELFF